MTRTHDTAVERHLAMRLDQVLKERDELLAALNALLNELHDLRAMTVRFSDLTAAITAARSVIAKAEGQS